MKGFSQNKKAKRIINCLSEKELEGIKLTLTLLNKFFPKIDCWTWNTNDSNRLNFGSKGKRCDAGNPVFAIVKKESSFIFRVTGGLIRLGNEAADKYGSEWKENELRKHYALNKLSNDASYLQLQKFLEKMSGVSFIINRTKGKGYTPDDYQIENTQEPVKDTDKEKDTPESYNADPRAWCQIKRRRGQPKFRKELMDHYNKTCAISGCTAVDALEAAHITPYAEGGDYSLENGLLLRVDIHTLYDLNLIGVDGDGYVHVSPKLDDDLYQNLAKDGKQVKGIDCPIFKENLEERHKKYTDLLNS